MMINECKKHPQHRQQPGVCSSCLTEKLTSHLSNLSPPPDLPIVKTKIFAVSDLFSPNSNSNSNISNSHSSASSSTSMSPAGHRRHASTGGSVGFIITTSTSATGSLKKSRSIAFVATSNRGGGGGGFWKKLIRSTGKGTKKVFMHSRTTRTVKTKV